MFKRETIGEDILFDMEKNLSKNAFIDDTQKTNQRIEAMELLEKAASNFEAVGKIKEAEAVTRVIEYVATPKVVKAEEMSVEEQEKNLEETGTQWPKSAFNGDPTEEEDKLYAEYVNAGLGEEIRVEEEVTAEAEDLNKQELVALNRLWG